LALAAPAFAQGASAFWEAEWPRTDCAKTSIDLGEVFSGGPPKDGIPAIDDPAMGRAADVELPPREPVLVLELEGETPRAWPLRYLTWHEIVNTRIGGRPVTATFCPLCNSALVFDGRVGGRELSFGVSGKLRHSDMIMYDRQTESWWQQFHGEAVVGELTGARLTVLPSWLEDWAGFQARHPDGLVMLEPTAWTRSYGVNPYAGYDSSPTPFLYRGEAPPHGVPALSRVVRVGARAWPLERLREAGEIEEAGLRLVWREGQASALDSRVMAEARDVGTVRVFHAGTGAPAVAEVVFAFAFHAFEPEGTWMLGE